MDAIQLTEKNQPLQLNNVPMPVAGPGQVLVQLRAAALNHRDIFIQQGLYPGITLPITLGSDGAGVVTEAGEGVDAVWRGQSVIINPALNWGSNPAFYGPDFQILGMPTNGTFAQYVAVPVQNVYRKPAHLSFEQAAALPLAGLTAWRALMSRANLRLDAEPERVLITGIGGGAALFALQFAVAAGAEVWVTSGSEEKLAWAREMGATGGVNYREPDWTKTLMAQTGNGRGDSPIRGYFDVIIDSAGGPGFAKLIDVVAAGGRIAFFGGTTGNITDVVPSKVFFKQLNIFGSTMGNDAEFDAMTQFVAEHGLVPVVDEVLPLANAEQAFRRMDAGKQFGKIVLTMSA